MPTVRLIPSAYTRSSTNRVTVADPSNMYDNTDDTTNYATLRGRNNSSSTYYCFIHGFNFTQVPSNANVTAFSVKIRCYRSSNQRTGSSYDLRLASSPSNSSVISGTTASDAIGISDSVITIPTGNLTWSKLSGYGTNFSIDVVLASNSSAYPYVYVYGAEIEVTYSVAQVDVTGVSVSPTTATIEQGETVALTETVAPSNATDKAVTWSSNNSAVATVSSGVVTGVGVGSATITVTTHDGGFTATCAVTVTAATFVDFQLATTLVSGEEYVIASGDSGSVYLVSTDAPSAQHLAGVAATVSNNRISITTGQAAKTVFTVELEDANNADSTLLKNGTQYLYTDSSSRLRMSGWTSSAASKHWHYKADGKNLLWFFKDSAGNTGYTDTSSTYKYYLTITNGVFADAYVSTTSLENTATPAMYLFKKVQSTGTPVITVGTPSRSIISDESGYDQCACTFQSDIDLQAWEARATKAGTTPARGVGLLVESGTTLAANTNATVYVDNEELTNGDGEYTITVYGQSTGGVWSE